MMKNSEKSMDKIIALCKNRGFVFAGSEIYGGLANSWDYGPLGVEFKNNVKKAWLKKFVQESPYNVGLDAAIIITAASMKHKYLFILYTSKNFCLFVCFLLLYFLIVPIDMDGFSGASVSGILKVRGKFCAAGRTTSVVCVQYTIRDYICQPLSA